MQNSETPRSDLTNENIKKIEKFRTSKDTSVLVVMFTDLKGSTKIAEKYGEEYAQNMRHLHDEMLLEIIERKGNGIHIKNIGDSILCVFSEPSVAVERALEIQRKLNEHNKNNPDKEPIIVRIGMHMGQVAVEDKFQTDIFGRHVNKAARVESLADGGQILITHGVYDSAKGWIKDETLQWTAHGAYQVKGILEPIRVYEVNNPEISLPRAPQGTRFVSKQHRFMRTGVAAAVFIIAALSILLWKTWTEKEEMVNLTKPSIAVMYFTNMTDNESDQALCAGMTATLTTDLQNLSGIAVIPRSQILKYRNTELDVIKTGKELEVSAVLIGSLQRMGNRIRIYAELVDIKSGSNIWSSRSNHIIDDISALQDTISSKIISALKVKLSRSEENILNENETVSFDAYHLYGRGIYYVDNEMYELALESFNNALKQDRSYIRAAFQKGLVLEKLKRWKDALSTYNDILPEGGKEKKVLWEWKFPDDLLRDENGWTQSPSGTDYFYAETKNSITKYYIFDPQKRNLSLSFQVNGSLNSAHIWVTDNIFTAVYNTDSESASSDILYGIESSTGRILWKFNFDNEEFQGFLSLKMKKLGRRILARNSLLEKNCLLDGTTGKVISSYTYHGDDGSSADIIRRDKKTPLILNYNPLKSRMNAYQAETGKILWENNFGDQYVLPLIQNDLVYIISSENVRCLDPDNGKIIWDKEIPGLAHYDAASMPKYEHHTFPERELLCVSASDGSVYGLNMQDGKTLWQMQIGKAFKISRRHKSLLYLTSADGDILALNIENGDIKLRSKIGEEPLDVNTVEDSVLYLRSERSIYSLDPFSGEVKWTYDHFSKLPPFRKHKNFIFFKPSGREIAVLDCEDGSRLYTYRFKVVQENFGELKLGYVKTITRKDILFIADDTGLMELKMDGFSKGQAILEKEILERIAICQFSSGDKDDAVSTARKVAEELAPGFASIHRTLAEFYWEMEKQDKAIDEYMNYFRLADTGKKQAEVLFNNLKDRVGLYWKTKLDLLAVLPVLKFLDKSVIIASGNINTNSSFYKIDTNDGNIIWKNDVTGHTALSDILDNSSILILTQNVSDKNIVLRKTDILDGSTTWSKTIIPYEKGAAYWFSGPDVIGEKIFLAVNQGKGLSTITKYICLDLKGNILWNIPKNTGYSPIKNIGNRNFEIFENYFITGFNDSLQIYNTNSGSPVHKTSVQFKIIPDFTLFNGRLYFETEDKYLNEFDLTGLKINNRLRLTTRIRSFSKSKINSSLSKRMQNGKIITWDNRGIYLYKFDTGNSDKNMIWKYDLSSRLVTPPRIENDIAYALNSENKLTGIDIETGTELFNRNLLWKAVNFYCYDDNIFFVSRESDFYVLSSEIIF